MRFNSIKINAVQHYSLKKLPNWKFISNTEEADMDFIERWLHISPDGGSGLSEVLILAVPIVIVLVVVSLRKDIPKNFIHYLEQLGRRESSDRFDN
jgi:hypothetical protein